MIKKIKAALKPYKKALILLSVFLLIIFVVKVVLPKANDRAANKSPIVKIKATNPVTYNVGSKFNVEDFEVIAIHKNGAETSVNSDEIKLSVKEPYRVGKTTKTEVSLKNNKNLKCTVKVKTDRQKVISFACGNPNISDVNAVLYSNGELCFEGEGNTLEYDENDFPWKEYEQRNDYPIRSITFEKDVKPISLDNYFNRIETLEWIENIPASVESAAYTFASCPALIHLPELSSCKNLVNMQGMLEGCSSLTEVPALPENVVTADSMCQKCEELQKAPDMSKATSLVKASNMFADCKKLTSIVLPPKVQIIDGILQNCINLKDMPVTPDTVISMQASYSNDTGLTNLTNIPASVKEVGSCFTECTKIKGVLRIDANPDNYSSFLNNVAVATKVDLQGSSKMLDVLANTSNDNINITVNGQAPNKELQ